MDKKVLSVKDLKKSLRKSNLSKTHFPENFHSISSQKPSHFTLDRFIPSKIDFSYTTLDTKVLNVFSNNKDLKKDQKSSYLKMIESELLENSTPSIWCINH